MLLRTGNKAEVCGVVEGTGKASYRWCLFFVLLVTALGVAGGSTDLVDGEGVVFDQYTRSV